MSTKRPLVSVCMPAYNAAGYIDQTLESILNQTYEEIEIVIVNDGSKDETARVLGKYAGRGNIRILHTENRGQCAAANTAFRHSHGEYIKFFDADDVMNPTHIEAQMTRVLERPGCIASCQVQRFYNDDLSAPVYEPLANWKDLPPLQWLIIDHGKGLSMMGACMFMIHRSFLEQSGLWNESLSLLNDYEFSPRFLLLAKEVLYTPDAVLYYRSGLSNSLSRGIGRARLVSAYTALELTESRLLKIADSDAVRSALAQSWHAWLSQFYLDEMDLYRKAAKHLRELGKYPDLYFQQRASRVRKMLGWKNHKRITRILNRIKKRFSR